MSVKFSVDEVERATNALPTRSLAKAFGDVLAVGGEDITQVVHHGPTHALLGAVHLAFAEHRSLVLSPDVMWLTIAEGFAQHVRTNATALRSRLVAHEGKERIEVRWPGPMPTDAAGWTDAVGLFRDALAGRIGDGRARLLECDFSTTGEVERTASRIVLMDAFSPYFDYFMICVCGIPDITLLGTADDWRSIRERIDVLDEFDCGFWTRSLAPIFDEFVAAAEGNARPEFWKRIYKPVDAYGGSVITGWIARLYPYLTHDRLNPLLALPLDEPRGATKPGGHGYGGPGVTTDAVLSAPSRVSVEVLGPLEQKRTVVLQAGVRAVAQNEDGSLMPVCAWTLRDGGTLSDVIERMKRDPQVTLHAANTSSPGNRGGAAEFVELSETASKVELFDGPNRWTFRPANERDHIRMSTGDLRHSLELIADLPHGAFLAAVACTSPPVFVRCEKSKLTGGEDGATMGKLRGNLEDLPIIAESLTSLLTLALDAGPGVELPAQRSLGEWMRERPEITTLTATAPMTDDFELNAEHPLRGLWGMGEPWTVDVSPARSVSSIACLKVLRGIGGMPLGALKAALADAAPVYTVTLQRHLPGLAEELANIRAIVDSLASHGGHRFAAKVGSHTKELSDEDFRELLGNDVRMYDQA